MAPPPFTGLLLALFAFSGALALVYQSLWTRELAIIMCSTTYAIGGRHPLPPRLSLLRRAGGTSTLRASHPEEDPPWR
jgi:hypothetical protein